MDTELSLRLWHDKMENFDNNLAVQSNRFFGWTHICMHSVEHQLNPLHLSGHFVVVSHRSECAASISPGIVNRCGSSIVPVNMEFVQISTMNRLCAISHANYPTLNLDAAQKPTQIYRHYRDAYVQRSICYKITKKKRRFLITFYTFNKWNFVLICIIIYPMTAPKSCPIIVAELTPNDLRNWSNSLQIFSGL